MLGIGKIAGVSKGLTVLSIARGEVVIALWLGSSVWNGSCGDCHKETVFIYMTNVLNFIKEF